MTFLILLLMIAATLALATVLTLPHDGRGPGRPPASHHDDMGFRFPIAW